MKAWRSTVLVLLMGAIVGAKIAAQGIVPTWLPIQVGNSWIYENEALEGEMSHPETGRWRTQETIVSSETKPEGVLLLTQSKALDPLPPIAKRQRVRDFDESYSLIRANCVYPGDMFRADTPPDLCFPLSSGSTPLLYQDGCSQRPTLGATAPNVLTPGVV